MNSEPARPRDPTPDLAAFRMSFRRHTAGVAIVTAQDASGRPVGFTATSLASLAAVPPLATFNIALSASSWPALAENDRVVIHMLGVRNKSVAELLSADNTRRFLGDHWYRGPHGLPVMKDVTAWMVARIVGRFPVHNSAVVVVQIEGGELGEPDAPLLYHERRYHRPIELG
ncbi:flavin oxidoreductase [Leifsonia xyli subsp. xyli]|uniref:Flavin-dependent reductase n=2 Tax=Leifsonia xyli subsp. xyli TaxID=59736 RepID=Q6AE75_LEIXX|nr:flavin reductase family protein [Leifsonia xyli]AAT89321.1 flavin-dependent reductase [Leifsonia xyli subsp. xyli str. CTCB07]ODA89650.1 flavin oxidoreductase [Leifsonia xyli subsp. xyli]